MVMKNEMSFMMRRGRPSSLGRCPSVASADTKQSSSSSSSSSSSADSARRCLFGRTGQNENKRILAELIDQQNQQMTSRWNFDFQSSTPLPGRYDWERVDPIGKPAVPCNDVINAADTDDSDNDSNDNACRLNSAVVTCEDVNDDVNDAVASEEITDRTGDKNIGKMNEITPFASLKRSFSSPCEKRLSDRMKRRCRRLTWAPKKKTGSLPAAHKQALREATITDYFPARKSHCFIARRNLKL